MTKDRARKRAARDRAATTGERYVVARREAVEPPSPSGGTLHDLTHRVPGVPAHIEGGLQGTTAKLRNSNPTPRNKARRHEPRVHDEPRVLVAWQKWIARRLGAGSR